MSVIESLITRVQRLIPTPPVPAGYVRAEMNFYSLPGTPVDIRLIENGTKFEITSARGQKGHNGVFIGEANWDFMRQQGIPEESIRALGVRPPAKGTQPFLRDSEGPF